MKLSQIQFEQLIRAAMNKHKKTQYIMDVVSIIPGTIDEMAILFPNEETLDAFVFMAARDPIVMHDRTVERDEMVRVDDTGRWHVRFEFFKMAGMRFRIEAMTVLDGHAPLHESALKKAKGNPNIFHASYKRFTEDGYEQCKDQLNRQVKEPVIMEAEYVNSYGRFSYWSANAIPFLYLKPRVNLRDNSQERPSAIHT